MSVGHEADYLKNGQKSEIPAPNPERIASLVQKAADVGGRAVAAVIQEFSSENRIATVVGIRDLLSAIHEGGAEALRLVESLDRNGADGSGERSEEKRLVGILVEGQLVTSAELGLEKENDIDLFFMLPKLRRYGTFAAGDVLRKDFMRGAKQGTRRNAFTVSRGRVFGALEKHLGAPVVKQTGTKRTAEYEFLVDIAAAEGSDYDSSSSGDTQENDRQQSPPPDANTAQEPAAPAKPVGSRKPAKPRPKTESEEPDEVHVNAGLLRATVHREEITESFEKGKRQRGVVKPYIEEMISRRRAALIKNHNSNRPRGGLTDRRITVLQAHWGIEDPYDPAPTSDDEAAGVEAKDVETIAMETGLTISSVQTMIREALKELIEDKKRPAARPSAEAYLKFLNEEE